MKRIVTSIVDSSKRINQMYLKSILAASLCFLSLGLHANIISTDYTSDVSNEVFWTNHALGLDIMRLSYSDTITATGDASSTQATVQTIENFLAQDDTGWGWATDQNLVDINNWFDTNPAPGSWSAEQFEGSSLFFELNGFGPHYTSHNNSGFAVSGDAYWYLIIESDFVDVDKHRGVLMRKYADGTEADCTRTTHCGLGYHAGDITGYYADHDKTSLGADNVNYAALLVRINDQGNGNVNELPAPNSIVWFSILVCGLAFRAKRLKAN